MHGPDGLRPSPTRNGRELARVGHGGHIFENASRRLRRTVPFDAAAWIGTDPATVLPTTPVRIENIPPGSCETYWRLEFIDEDVLLFRDLARSADGGGTLLQATHGSPQRSRRHRDVLVPRGYGDSLRATFRVGASTWGVVDLFREAGRPPFTDRDVRAVTSLGTEIAMSLAALATASPTDTGSTTPEGPGTALYDHDGRLQFIDQQAQRWMDELTQSTWTESSAQHLMAPIWSLLARAQAATAGRGNGPASARLRTGTGRWLALHASCLRDAQGQSGLIAVVIEPANSAQIAPIIVEAYNLTPREQQVTQGVARGLSNTNIAAELFVSAHTVRDHLKAVFAKLGVASRGELVAKIFAEHYGPAIHNPSDDVVHSTLP
jgi:DNA-binding CsgD family transcriptional regulator